ncbi:MAG: RNA polymerase sigma factor [Planctomycetales bacterium]|nr:RNA polymerase sigma factor [Planctomycetales bacterium]
MATTEIRDLVNLCMRKDDAATKQLMIRFRDRVFAICYRMLGQQQDAEDVVQETFLRAVRSLSSWDQQREFEPWLFQIAANRCKTMLSRRQRRPIPLPYCDESAPDDSQMLAADRETLAEEVRRVLDAMRPEQREAFCLFHESELSYAEIAERLDCPLGTVKTWVHRARAELIRQLQTREVLS